MNQIILYAVLFSIVLFQPLYGQNIPIPLDIQKAYSEGTRNLNGSPGAAYWQNRADYQISVSLDPEQKIISGSASIEYHNNSPRALKEIVIRLYQNLYKKGNFRDFAIDPNDLHDGVSIQKIEINNQPYQKEVEQTATRLILPLENALLPGKSIKISLTWSYPISQYSTVREGYFQNTNAFFIAYWYPQIAKYDDVWGWNNYDFTGMQEFYNDFNNYKVEIAVPKGFVVWATGILQNPKDNLSDRILERYQKAKQATDIIKVIEEADYQNGLVTSDKDTLTWSYHAENVTDFSFAASNHYLWDATSIIVGEGNQVLVSAVYDKQSADFYEVADISKKSIEYFSKEMPGVPYPYPAMTIFNGKGGMEFPMMVNDGSMAERWSTVHVTSHEIAHTYFPFYMGTNEQMYAFMDEGWAVMLPFELQKRIEPGYDPISRVVRFYEESAVSSLESQLMLPSIALSGNTYRETYRNSAYNKSGLAYWFLQESLGEELFKKALHTYISRWNGKNPLPYDFFFTFDEVAGEDLSWFWKPWFFENGYPDLGIQAVEISKSSTKIVIKNYGGIPIPAQLQIDYADGSNRVIRESPSIWKSGDSHEIILKGSRQISKITLGSSTIPDVRKENNNWIRNK